MADLKISAATLNPAPVGSDAFATDKAGVDFRTTLTQIQAFIGSAPVDSVFGRTGVVTALQADYDAFFLTPAEGNAAYMPIGGIASFNGRVGAVLPVQADYDSFFLTPAEGDLAYAPISVTGITDLAYVAATRTVTSDTGTDAVLGLFSATLDGMVPLSGGGTANFLRADGSWAVPPGGGGGDVFKVGTPLNDQVGVWTGDGTLEGTNALKYSTAIGLSIAAGGGDFILQTGAGNFRFATTSAGALLNESATGTNPSIVPAFADLDTGLGLPTFDQLALIAGGVQMALLIEAGTSATDQFFLPRDGAAATPALAIGSLDRGWWSGGVAQINASIGGVRVLFFNSSALTMSGSIGVESATGPRMLQETPSATNPVINVRQNDVDTGLGSNAIGSMSQISDGEESTRTVAASAGGLQANNQDTGGGLERVLTESDLSVASVVNDAVQARRTTSFTIIASFVDVTLDATDIETDDAVIEHDAVTDRIVAKVTGTYKIAYEFDIDNALVSGSDLILAEGRVRLNDGGTGINGSLASTSAFRDTSVGTGNENRFFSHLSNEFIADLTANDFVTLQINQIPDTGGLEVFTAENVSLQVTRLL